MQPRLGGDDAKARRVGLGRGIVGLLILRPLPSTRQRQLEQLRAEVLAEQRIRQARGILATPQAGSTARLEVGDQVVGRFEGALAEGKDRLAGIDKDRQVDDPLALADPVQLDVEVYISSSPPSAKPWSIAMR